MQICGVFVALIKRCSCQSHKSESLVSIVGNDLDSAVVYAHLFVGVSDGDVDGKVVVETVVVLLKLNWVREAFVTLNLGSWGRKMSQNTVKDKEKQKMIIFWLIFINIYSITFIPQMVSISVWTIEE